MLLKTLQRELDSYHYDNDDMIQNIKNICDKNRFTYTYNYKYEPGSLFPDVEGQFIIRLKHHYFIVESEMLYTPKKMLNNMNQSKKIKEHHLIKRVEKKTRTFYDYVKSRIPDYWNHHTLQGIAITDEFVKTVCCIFGSDVVVYK